MTKSFYPRLAAQNLIKNGKFYFPYLLTVVITAAAFYITVALAKTPNMPDMTRYAYLSGYMSFGGVVLALFTFVFLIYTNSFLMKRRVKELGLYNVLGMGKKNIGLVLCFESLYTWLIGTGLGIVLGMVFQKLMTMLAQKLMRVDVVFHYYISVEAIGITALIFGAVILLTLLVNLRRLHVQDPVELLRGGNVGEREPRTRWLLALLGVLSLGAGYYLAISTDDAVTAIAVYFVAVILVIVGTYCLFGAVSIAVLKAMRKKKSFYYRTGNFIGVSGMLHRMNRNAVGLGNICILSTMVMVMVSATFSLYAGTEDSLNSRYPAQINVDLRYNADEPFDTALAGENLINAVTGEGYDISEFVCYSSKSAYVSKLGGRYYDVPYGSAPQGAVERTLSFLSRGDYIKLGGQCPELQPGQILIAGAGAESESVELIFRQYESGDEKSLSFEVLPGDANFLLPGDSAFQGLMEYWVFPDSESLLQAAEHVKWAGNSFPYINWSCRLDIDGTAEEQMACADFMTSVDNIGLTENERLQWEFYQVNSREYNRAEFYSTNGGFFFLGIFLGIIFIMAMVLIMYYKQISEGYEDRERFIIMQQVGLPKKDIRRSINMQVLVVFFAPLVVAGIHIVFDFNLVRMLLTLFGMVNWKLAALCTLGTFAIFTLLYALVYALTAKTYYKIVSEKSWV